MDLSPTRKDGRYNLYKKSITQSSDLYVGEIFITEALNHTLIPISEKAQSDLNALYLFPKEFEKLKEKLNYQINELKAHIQSKKTDHVLPNSLRKSYPKTASIQFNEHTITRNINFESKQYKKIKKHYIFKDTKRANKTKEWKELKEKNGKHTADYSILSSNLNPTGYCAYCNNCNFWWRDMVECMRCGCWYHMDNEQTLDGCFASGVVHILFLYF